MRTLRRASSAFGYGFTAWLAAALLAYAVEGLRFAAIAGAFWAVFRLYFHGQPDPLHPAAAAVVGLLPVAAIDLALLGPYHLHPMDMFKSFWDWQLPALVAFVAVVAAARGRKRPAEAKVPLTKTLDDRH